MNERTEKTSVVIFYPESGENDFEIILSRKASICKIAFDFRPVTETVIVKL